MPEQAQNKSSELSDEEKYIKKDHVRNRYGNVPKEYRQKSKQMSRKANKKFYFLYSTNGE